TQIMLADMAMKVEDARLMVYTAAANAERGTAPGGETLGFMAAASKPSASHLATEVPTNAVPLFGGPGDTRDLPMARMRRDGKITQIYEGTNQICRMVMARQILG